TPFEHRSLRLYSAPRWEGPWEEHPESPIVQSDAAAARPAGRGASFDGPPLPLAQDCLELVGGEGGPFVNIDLQAEKYREQRASAKPVLGAGATGHWRTSRMHHLDAHPQMAGRWIACVDGWPDDGDGSE